MKSIFVDDIRLMSDDDVKGLIKGLEEELNNRKKMQAEDLMKRFKSLFCEYEKLARIHYIEINDEEYSFETILESMQGELGLW